MILSILELGMVPCLTFVSRYNGMKEFAEYYARSACLHMGWWEWQALTKNCLSYLIKLEIFGSKILWKLALRLSYQVMDVPHLDLFCQTFAILAHFMEPNFYQTHGKNNLRKFMSPFLKKNISSSSERERGGGGGERDIMYM